MNEEKISIEKPTQTVCRCVTVTLQVIRVVHLNIEVRNGDTDVSDVITRST